jgi:dCMP deaminase
MVKLQYVKESEKWGRRYMDMARLISTWSKHPEFKVGALAVGDFGQILSEGYNGWPRSSLQEEAMGRQSPTQGEAPSLTIHAEMNVIYNASLNGLSLRGSTLYVFPMYPCLECAKAIVQVGITRICYQETDAMLEATPRWKSSWERAELLFREANIRVTRVRHV